MLPLLKLLAAWASLALNRAITNKKWTDNEKELGFYDNCYICIRALLTFSLSARQAWDARWVSGEGFWRARGWRRSPR
jgi:hypothetical protein